MLPYIMTDITQAYRELEGKCATLENLSGLPLDVLINKFAKGYELTLPENINPFEQLSDIDFNPFQALTDEEIKNIIKGKDDFILNCFLKHGFDCEDIIANIKDFRIIANETRAGVSSYIVFYKDKVLFKIRETLVLNEEADILSNGLSFKTYLEEVLDE